MFHVRNEARRSKCRKQSCLRRLLTLRIAVADVFRSPNSTCSSHVSVVEFTVLEREDEEVFYKLLLELSYSLEWLKMNRKTLTRWWK